MAEALDEEVGVSLSQLWRIHRRDGPQAALGPAKLFAWTYTGDPLKADNTRGTCGRQH